MDRLAALLGTSGATPCADVTSVIEAIVVTTINIIIVITAIATINIIIVIVPKLLTVLTFVE